jgi:hypothetical protein
MQLEDLGVVKPSAFGPSTTIASAIAIALAKEPIGMVIVPPSYTGTEAVAAAPGCPVLDLRVNGTLATSAISGNYGTFAGLGITGSTAATVVGVVNGNYGFAVFNAGAVVNLAPTTAPSGIYRLTAQLVITTSFVTNTEITMAFGWADADQATTLTLTTAAKTAGTYLPATAGGTISALVNNSQTFYNVTGTAITYTPGNTGTAATAGAAQVSIVLERLA